MSLRKIAPIGQVSARAICPIRQGGVDAQSPVPTHYPTQPATSVRVCTEYQLSAPSIHAEGVKLLANKWTITYESQENSWPPLRRLENIALKVLHRNLIAPAICGRNENDWYVKGEKRKLLRFLQAQIVAVWHHRAWSDAKAIARTLAEQQKL